MKKCLAIAAFICSFLVTSNVSAQNAMNYSSNNSMNNEACCPEACPQDQACGDCYCKMVRYEPCYYTTKRCVEEQIPCKKKCYRKVPCYTQVERCRMVPEKYCETVCTYKTECYEVDDCKTCQKIVCDQHCKWVPKYYWKHTCAPVASCAPAASCAQ